MYDVLKVPVDSLGGRCASGANMTPVAIWPARWCYHCDVGANLEHCWICGERMGNLMLQRFHLHDRDTPPTAA